MAAIIASLVGFLALLVAGYTAYIERYTAEIQNKQVQAQVWPHLHLSQSTFPPSIHVVNQGMGPAIVRSVEVLVNGKPQPDWDHVFAAVGMQGNVNTQGPKLNGNVLAPGYDMIWENFGFTQDQYRDFIGMMGVMDAAKATSSGNAGATSSAPKMPSYELFQARQRVLFNRFIAGAQQSRFQVRICYCSTLGDCNLVVWGVRSGDREMQMCQAIPRSDQFHD